MSSIDKERRVVVTAIGLVSTLGLSPNEVAEALREGRSSIQVIPERQDIGFRSPLSGVIPPLDPSDFLKKKELKNMGEHTQFAAIAAAMAFSEPGADPSLFASESAGVFIGNDSSSGSATDVLDMTRNEGTTETLGSGAVVRCMNSSATINLGVKYKVQGMSMTLSAADAGGAHAIGLGWQAIKSGRLERAIVGGCQEMCWESMAAFDAREAFSTRADDPVAASRPFDRDRDGMVPSGGAAVLLLEDLNLARQRGAPIWGEIAGYAMTSDGKPGADRTVAGRVRCIRDALAQAGLDANQIDLIAADASGSKASDLAEALAIIEVFGTEGSIVGKVAGPAITATKSMTGHEGWASGPLRTAYTLLMMRDGFIAPNINHAHFAEGEPRLDISSKMRKATVGSALVNTFGYGGTNGCLVLRAIDQGK